MSIGKSTDANREAHGSDSETSFFIEYLLIFGARINRVLYGRFPNAVASGPPVSN